MRVSLASLVPAVLYRCKQRRTATPNPAAGMGVPIHRVWPRELRGDDMRCHSSSQKAALAA
eukprot:NODE_6234_length_520_cov_414.838710.p5 GENE.NODE_6234_length_520_cov_414.838710~~NODE_6234_length_520_cov_414.838710.p5  ORF type:complete len:61 (+),score=0.66 NODE_6234_length_520_cov_414.838710:140-322(+)